MKLAGQNKTPQTKQAERGKRNQNLLEMSIENNRVQSTQTQEARHNRARSIDQGYMVMNELNQKANVSFVSDKRSENSQVRDYNQLIERLKEQHQILNNEALTQIMQIGKAPLAAANQVAQNNKRIQQVDHDKIKEVSAVNVSKT